MATAMKIQSALRSISLPCLMTSEIPQPMTGGVFGLSTLALFIFASVAAADIVTGLDAGGASQVKNFDNNGFETASFFAYPGFMGGVRVGAREIVVYGAADIITGTGTGAAGGNVKVFDGVTGALIRSFLAFDPSFAGGVFVAGGDVNGDGSADIIVGTDTGSSQVKVFDGATGAVIASFFAYTGFTGGVRVGAGDISGDGAADIITGTGPGAAGGNVKVFDGVTGALIRNFLAFDPSFTGGVFVAGGDVNGGGSADIIVGTDTGSSQVKVFDGATGAVIASFFAYTGFTGGVRVGAGDISGDGAADIITGTGPGAAGGNVKVFDGVTGALIRNFLAFDPSFTGGVFVAGGDVNGGGSADIIVGTDTGSSQVKVFDGATGAVIASFFAYTGFTGGVRVGAGDISGD